MPSWKFQNFESIQTKRKSCGQLSKALKGKQKSTKYIKTEQKQSIIFNQVLSALFTLKMMLIYSVHTIHARYLRKVFYELLCWINLKWLILVKLFLKNKNKNCCKKSLWSEIQVRTILVCALCSIKYRIIPRNLVQFCLLHETLLIFIKFHNFLFYSVKFQMIYGKYI